MRWSIVRLIWLRELRDQLRDRRTVFMMAVLPILLYPLLGVGLLQFTLLSGDKPSVVGVYTGVDNSSRAFPNLPPSQSGHSPILPAIPAAAWVAGVGPGLDRLLGTAVLVRAGLERLDDPLLLERGELPPPLAQVVGKEMRLRFVFLDQPDRSLLKEKRIDVLLLVDADFGTQLHQNEQPSLEIVSRAGDDQSQLARRRLNAVLDKWRKQLREVRLLRHGLSPAFERPFRTTDVENEKSSGAAAAEDIFDMMVKIFPFVLVMWSLAGALYPAVDICAGEKERGTMETLLISPASRKEIVWGKFLTIWVFSAASAILNLVSMGITTAVLGSQLPVAILKPAALFWCVLLVLPQSALFSALCLAVGAYARSSKEGQHYLMPLFLLTMPLIFLTLAPGVKLSPLYSLVPVTGVALLLQELMAASTLETVPWIFFLPVLAPIVLYSWLALRWAVDQFQREEVLFREAERLDLKLWMRHLLRDKEPLPSSGQAFFCFGLLVMLQWVSLGFGAALPFSVHAAIRQLAFIAAPVVLMTVLLTTKPRHGLALRWPAPKAWALSVILAVLLLPPLAEITLRIIDAFPDVKQLLLEHYPIADALGTAPDRDTATRLRYFLALALLPAFCEELAFRGFILSGLRARFRPWTAILISSFMFALVHMNVFQFVPSFLLGVVLGILAVRSSSVLPGMVFHLLHNTLVIAPLLLAGMLPGDVNLEQLSNVRLIVAILCAVLALPILWRLASRMWTVDHPVPEGPLPEPEAQREPETASSS